MRLGQTEIKLGRIEKFAWKTTMIWATVQMWFQILYTLAFAGGVGYAIYWWVYIR